MPVEETEEYIRIRVRNPAEFRDGTFRTVWLSKPKGINSVQGKLKKPPEGQEGSMVVQSLLFVKDKWTREEALRWAREHGYKPKAIDEVEMKGEEIVEMKDLELIEEDESKSGGAPEMEHKANVGEIKEIDEKHRTLVHYISSEAVDRDKEIMRVGGCKLDNFKRNAVVLWAHNYRGLPIGKNVWIKRPKDGSGILAKTQFANHQFADEVFQMYKEGFLNAWSVGFIPLESKEPDDDDNVRRIIEKWELLEYSAVPVPSNPDALQLAYQKGIIGNELAKDLGLKIKEKITDPHFESMEYETGGYDGEKADGGFFAVGEKATASLKEIIEKAKEKGIIEISSEGVMKFNTEMLETPTTEEKSGELTGEEIDAWKKKVKQAIIAGVRNCVNRALGKVEKKEEDSNGRRKDTG